MDFYHVISQQQAIELAAKGELEKILLIPLELGGQDIPTNTVYAPIGIRQIQDQLTGTIIRFLQEGLINKIAVKPIYKGDSFIPSKIEVKTWHSEKEGGFNPVIEIW